MKKLVFIFLISIIGFAQKKETGTLDSVSYYINLTDIYKKKNNYNTAISKSYSALNYAQKYRDASGRARALSSLGNIYLELKKINDAIDYFNKSIETHNNLPITSELGLIHYKLGLCYMHLEDFSKAEENFEKAEYVYNYLKIENQDLIKLQKGILYKNYGKIDEANQIFNSIISSKNNSDDFVSAEALYQLGMIEMSQDRYNLAQNYLNRSLVINNDIDNIEQRIKILGALSRVNENLMNTNKAYLYLVQHVKLRDSLLKMSNFRLASTDGSLKETDRLELFAKLTKENEEQQRNNKFTKVIGILAISLITILSLLSLALYKNNIMRTQTNKLLQEKNNELELAKEKAEKASQARADFLSTVSHELRTPLNAINGITHLLIEENPRESQIHYLKSLQFSGNYLLTFINDILEINRIESKNVEVENIEFNLRELLENIHNSLEQLAKVNNNELVIDYDENVPHILKSDPTKLSQIFINLINNALKFTKNGTVKVIVESFGIKDNKAMVHFSVQDNGIGIAEEKQKTIFESFSQGSIEINRKYGGTGLGLAIVKKLIELLGGKIQLESNPGEGSNFYFNLQLEIVQENKASIENEKSINEETLVDVDSSNEMLHGKHVLIVEDNKINQMITKKMIEKKGMTTQIIDNGEDAIIEVKENPDKYDLILMDVHLPGINGTIATKNIREFNSSIPVIALTAISLNENRNILLSFGMNDVITKPFVPENFYQVISKVLSNSKSVA